MAEQLIASYKNNYSDKTIGPQANTVIISVAKSVINYKHEYCIQDQVHFSSDKVHNNYQFFVPKSLSRT